MHGCYNLERANLGQKNCVFFYDQSVLPRLSLSSELCAHELGPRLSVEIGECDPNFLSLPRNESNHRNCHRPSRELLMQLYICVLYLCREI